METKRSLTGKRWIIGDLRADTPDELVTALSLARGIASIGKESYTALPSPDVFVDMQKAVERILFAVKEKEVVVIFGDYDADGITATVQLARYFRRHGHNAHVLLPHRVKDGYGLKMSFIDEAKKFGATLLITVDTGITAHKEIEYAATLGIDVIVTDHHHPRLEKPSALAVIHPAYTDPPSYDILSGSAVALMLVRALEKAEGNDHWNGIEEDIVLATIGTVADAMPLIRENRILVQSGLRCVKRLQDGPLKTFLSLGEKPRSIDTSADIGFRIAPLINACGRMSDPKIAFDALFTGDEDAMKRVLELNAERRLLTDELMLHAEERIDRSDDFIVLAQEEYPAGLVGLIAGRVSETTGKPTLVGAIKDGVVTASLRSVPEVDLRIALAEKNVSEHLSAFGGHAKAAGCSYASSRHDDLRRALNEHVASLGLSNDVLSPRLTIDARIASTFLTIACAEMLALLEPFGQGNEEPTFVLEGLTVDNVRRVGMNDRHLQCRVGACKAIGFGLGPLLDQLKTGERYDIACVLGKEVWNGKTRVQLFIEDIALSVQTGTSEPSTWKTSVTSV